ncbi:MAG: hypothetical protein IPH86_05625 [bacterium]|nr:hypothetical protein [bacterium]
MEGDRAWVAGYGAIRVYDLGDPLSPIPLGTLPLSGYVSDLTVVDGSLLIGISGYGLRIASLTAGPVPVLVGALPFPGGAADVVFADGLAIVAAGTGGLVICDISDPAQPQVTATLGAAVGPVLAGAVELPDFATSLSGRDGSLWLSVGNTGLIAVDTTAPLAPAVSDLVELPGISYDCVLAGDVAFVAGSDELRVVDLAQPVPSATLGWYLAPSGPRSRWPVTMPLWRPERADSM